MRMETETELAQITAPDGTLLDIREELCHI